MRALTVFALVSIALTVPVHAQTPPHDLWTPEVLQRIRDPRTLNLQIIQRSGYAEVFFDSETDARWADSERPYRVHKRGTIRIHGYLATPAAGGPYPALVIGHGHGGEAELDAARVIAALGYGAFSISGPGAGLSTGGPEDTEQAWISVEEKVNEPSPDVSYLYHYAYAGMRALTVLEALSALPGNPFRIDRTKLGIAGASMGGQLTYYVNGVDDRVKAAIAIAVAGDWLEVLEYPGAWLFHGLYYHTRSGLSSGVDALNTISSCEDPTLATFAAYFDPISYAPTQHAPLLTIIGSHDQYFVPPAINTTYDRVAPAANASPRFIKRIYIAPNGEHGVIHDGNLLGTVLALLGTVDRWLKYSFGTGPAPVETPDVTMSIAGDWMLFRASAAPGAAPTTTAQLFVASQMDTLPEEPCDFFGIPLLRFGDAYIGAVRIGQRPPCGPPVTTDNVLYFASVSDASGYTLSSKLYYRGGLLAFGSGFTPVIEHWDRDDFPVVPPPMCTAR
jgi:cephalosporin-C deacetylase-like acetyl esterase